MKVCLLLISTILSCTFPAFEVHGQTDYTDYHREILKCERLIAEHKFQDAISHFDSLFMHYDFVFLRDCQLATQLCAFEQKSKTGFRFLRKGIKQGWTLKQIKKNERLGFLHTHAEWPAIESAYDSLHALYLSRLNTSLREQVRSMYKKDQKKAIGALFRIGEKSQTRYAERKFAPHSEKQLAQLKQILTEKAYPGEKITGNNWWVSVILSHHNSISQAYVQKDTLYSGLRPLLIKAIEKGELHPYEFATIEDWRCAALYEHQSTSYGFLGVITDSAALKKVNRNRAAIGLRSVELRNALIDIEQQTGLNLYLPKGWQKGKIR